MHKSRLTLNLLIHVSYEAVNQKMDHDRQFRGHKELVVSRIRDQKEAREHVHMLFLLLHYDCLVPWEIRFWVYESWVSNPLTPDPGRLGVFVKDILVSWSYLLLSTMNFHVHPKKQNNNNFFWEELCDRKRPKTCIDLVSLSCFVTIGFQCIRNHVWQAATWKCMTSLYM